MNLNETYTFLILLRWQEWRRKLTGDYKGKKRLFIAILNGAFIFAADLFKYITLEAEICFIKLASYKGVKSTGR